MRTTPVGQVVKRVVPAARPSLVQHDQKSMQDKIVISPKP